MFSLTQNIRFIEETDESTKTHSEGDGDDDPGPQGDALTIPVILAIIWTGQEYSS